MVSIVGNIVSIVVPAQHDSSCNSLPIQPREYDIAGLPVPGVYRIRVNFQVPNGGPGGFMGGRNIVVVSGAAVPTHPVTIPALSVGYEVLAVGLLGVIGLLMTRYRA